MVDNIVYPYQNLSLEDMEGEIWKDIKGYEGNYMVSNLGRAKRLKIWCIHINKHGRQVRRSLPERIVRQFVKYSFNKYINQTLCVGVGLTLQTEGVRTHLHTSRLVYEAFIGKIPVKAIIQHKDNDPQNNCVGNLYQSTRSQLTYKLHEQGRAVLLTSNIGIKHSAERISRQIAAQSKEVSQYDLQGNWIATYKSIKEAEIYTKISRSSISNALSGMIYIAGGFVWRTEKKSRIDLSEHWQHRFRSRANNCRTINQYTQKGKLIATYKSASEASRASDIPLWLLYRIIHNKPVHKKNQSKYIWRLQEEDE